MKINEKTMPLNMLRINFSLKSLINTLKIWFFIIPLFTLDAKEPVMLMLKNNISNGLQEFKVLPHYSFRCKPYGIVTLDELLNSKKLNKQCQKTLERFYVQHPDLYNLHSRYLHTRSFYHVEYEEKSCIIYAKGLLTYSEILLKNGVAYMKKDLKHKVLKPRFQLSQEGAQIGEKGIFSDPDVVNCIKTY